MTRAHFTALVTAVGATLYLVVLTLALDDRDARLKHAGPSFVEMCLLASLDTPDECEARWQKAQRP